MSWIFQKGATSKSIYVLLRDSTTGIAKTALVFNSAGAVASYTRAGATRTVITLATLAAADSAYSSGGFKEVQATDAPGLYRLDIPNAAIASGVDDVLVSLVFTGVHATSVHLDLTTDDPKAAAATTAQIASAVHGKVETELTGPPPIDGATFEEQVKWVYHFLRNRRTTSNAQDIVLNSANAAIATSTLSEAAGIFTKTAHV